MNVSRRRVHYLSAVVSGSKIEPPIGGSTIDRQASLKSARNVHLISRTALKE